MNIMTSLRVMGGLLLVLGVAQLAPTALSFVLDEADGFPLLIAALMVIGAGVLLVFVSKGANQITEQDGYVAVSMTWVAAGAAGAMPYLFTGVIGNVTDALYESLSGFTTTGVSVFEDYSGLSQGLLMWRSMTEWMGGMGIIVLGLVILPTLGIGGMQLFKHETPGPTQDKLTPRLRDTAKLLWQLYLGLTLLLMVILRLLGMTWLEALNHAMTTLGTGGFSTRAGSIGDFNNPAIEWTMSGFMLIGAINFGLTYRLLFGKKHRLALLKDEELLWFLSVVVFVITALALGLHASHHYTWPVAWTKATFQTTSLASSSGFASADYGAWPSWMQMLLLIVMIPAGCAGSTSGGMKMVRAVLAFKGAFRDLQRMMHPRAVRQLRLNGAVVETHIQTNIYAYCLLYVGTLLATTFLISLDGLNIISSFGVSLSAISNIGPSFGLAGPANTHTHFSPYTKWILMVGMVMGRLELMTVIMMLSPHLWRK